MMRHAAMVAALVIATVGAPKDVPSRAPTSLPGPSPVPETLVPMVVSSQLWVGDNDLILDLLHADGGRIDDAGLTGVAMLTSPDGVVGDRLDLQAIRLASLGRTLYRTPVTLDATGSWSVTVTATSIDGAVLEGEARFEVLPDDGTPALGRPVVPIDTPTLESSGFDLASITTDREPLPSLYWSSVSDALRDRRPFMFVIDTVRLGVNDACGSAIGEARQMPGAFPGLLAIHAEPFVTGPGDAVLVRDPVDEPARIAPWATAWGVTGPPWLFVVDADGILQAKFHGVFGTDELLSALRKVAPYSPGKH